jgi:hypothetical protein
MNRTEAGRQAKIVGHQKEQWAVTYLQEVYGGEYQVDGGNRTKVDIFRTDKDITYSMKSVSGKNTQCHLTSSQKWMEHFNIEGKLREWFHNFFGVPGMDVSWGSSKQHRMKSSEIDSDLNELATNWFNQNRMGIFEVIVRSGMYNTPVDYLIWHNKLKNTTEVIDINDLATMVYNGEWRLNDTTLEFVSGGKKLFHLQMKGSGKKFTSGYHGLMFHIHN